MDLRTSHVKHTVVSLLLLALPVGAASIGQAASAETTTGTSVASDSARTTVYQETFERGTKRWTASRRATVRANGKGRDSRRAARVARTSKPGVAVLRTRISGDGTVGARLVAKAHLRSPRGRVPARLVVREVEPSTGAVLAKHRDRVRAGARWTRARVRLDRTSATSVVKVEVRTTLRRRQALLVDDVTVHRGRTGVAQTPQGPPTTPTTPTGAAWPDAGNTGPTGNLTAYTGPMNITTDGTVIDSKVINGYLRVNAAGVVIRNSQVNGQIDNYEHPRSSLTIEDSLVQAPDDAEKAVRNHNLTIVRTEITGGAQSIDCNSNCTVTDSWLHGQVAPGGQHSDGFLSNGGNGFTLRHNTLACDAEPNRQGGACSAALAMYDDFGAVRNVVVDNNLFKASPAGYCMYAGHGTDYAASNVDITNNVFERSRTGHCGAFGAVASQSRATDAASTWANNRYTDGALIN